LTFFEFSFMSFTLKFVGVVSILIPCFDFNFLHPRCIHLFFELEEAHTK
jgi:hypothetical protein